MIEPDDQAGGGVAEHEAAPPGKIEDPAHAPPDRPRDITEDFPEAVSDGQKAGKPGEQNCFFVRPEVTPTDAAFDLRLFGDDRRELIHRQGQRFDGASRADNGLFLDLQSHLLIVWSAAQEAGHQSEQNDEDQHKCAPEYDRAGATRRDDGQTLFDV